MQKTEFFKITRVSSLESHTISSDMKSWQIYDKETAISFFYSRIEACWLIIVNSGSCTINGNIFNAKTNNHVVIEDRADIGINGIAFSFYNQSIVKGISKILSCGFLKKNEVRMSTEKVLKIIQENCEYYKDFYFVLEAIRKNTIFSYNQTELSLNVEVLLDYMLKGCSPVVDSVKYEFENDISRYKLKSFNIGKIWTCADFRQKSVEKSRNNIKWPAFEQVQNRVASSSARSKQLLTNEILKSPESSGRYINPYTIGHSKDKSTVSASSNSSDGEKKASRYTNKKSLENSMSSLVSSDDNNDFTASRFVENCFSRPEKRKGSNGTDKRCKYQFKINTKPTVETIKFSSDSEQSTASVNSEGNTKSHLKRKKIFRRSASCVEPGFLTEWYNSMHISRKHKEKLAPQKSNVPTKPNILQRYCDYKLKKN
ncbi:hypothetical protein GINT2_000551 [Glugoides intestinalis]